MVEEARELTSHPRLLESIDAVLRIIGGRNNGSKYGKGRPLVDALEDTAREAFLHEDFALARRFQHFAAYARGDLYLQVLENMYDDEARQFSEEYMRRVMAMGADRAVAALDVLCRDRPDATAADARDLFRGIAVSTGRIGIGSGQGGIRLSARDTAWLQQLGHMELVFRALPESPSAAALRLVSDNVEDVDAGLLAQLLELRARRAGVAALRATVEDPNSSESALHDCLKNQEWLFGGAYVAELARRQYTPDTILDIPLLRGDGALHVVELKRANIRDLVIRRSGHLMLGAPAHQAVSQAQNYLRAMDENRQAILDKHRVDSRRASATVVIGHPRYVKGTITQQEIAETLRTYNTHTARIEVITYETLLKSASRMLALASPVSDSDKEAGT
ncbi:Shedu anti-phage system protein SduA domain-containing protein [Spirillospora sp. NPDC052269]